MTDERIDIEITDKVDPKVATKIKAIAAAARDAETSIETLQRQLSALNSGAVEKLAAASARLTGAQARQTSANARLANANARLETQNLKLAIGQQKLAAETAKAESATSKAAIAASRAAIAVTQQQAAVSRLAAAQAREAAAVQANSAAQQINNRVRQQGSRQSRQSLQQTQNLIFQLNDIVVGLASGQKPLTVLIQQGSQISTIFGPGNGVLGTLRLLGASLAGIFAPLLPVIAVVGTIAAGFKVLQREINKTADTQVTFGDTFLATFQLIGDYISNTFPGTLSTISTVFETIVAGARTFVNTSIGLFIALGKSVSIVFDGIRGNVAYAMALAYNKVAEFISKAIKLFVELRNKAAETFNFLTASKDFKIIDPKTVGNIQLSAEAMDRLKKASEGTAAKLKEVFSKATSTDYIAVAADAVSGRAQENARKRIAEENAKKKGGRKATFGDITTKFQNDIAELQQTGEQRKILTAILDAEEKLHRKLTETEKEELGLLAAQLEAARSRAELLDNVNRSLTDYNATLTAGNELLNQGKISLEAYNTALANTQLATDVRSVEKSLPEFEYQAQIEELNIQQQERIAIIQQGVEARILTEQQGAERIKAINEQLARDLGDIETARQSVILTGASETFDQLANAAAGFAGEQSGLYQTLFAVSKAFAIADSIIKIQQGIANAISLPFPANIAAVGTVVAAASNIVSSIRAVQFSGQKKKDGGMIYGPGGPRSDSVPIQASNGEFIVNAEATKRNRPLLEAINDNKAITSGSPATTATNMIAASGGRGIAVSIQNFGTSKDFDVQQVSKDEVRIIARDEARKIVRTDAPRAVASDMNNPNGAVSKSLSSNIKVERRR